MNVCPFGTHRVVEPKGVLPQPAWKLDNDMSYDFDQEILIDVRRLNIDSASFRQILEECGEVFPDKELEDLVGKKIQEIVHTRGKMHNPVTGSGGMLIGQISRISPELSVEKGVSIGDKVAMLVSLSLTPLWIDQIQKVYLDRDQVEIKGKAVLFKSGVLAKLPSDLSEALALSILDVAGAPIQTARMVRPGDTVLIVGAAGKSGILCSYIAKKMTGSIGRVIGLIHEQDNREELEQLHICDQILTADATQALEVYEKVARSTSENMADVTINVVNAPNSEMGCILSTRNYGKLYFFSMATSFTKAALGAEGVGKDLEMIIGNGYAKEHAQYALDIVRENLEIRQLFEKRYG